MSTIISHTCSTVERKISVCTGLFWSELVMQLAHCFGLVTVFLQRNTKMRSAPVSPLAMLPYLVTFYTVLWCNVYTCTWEKSSHISTVKPLNNGHISALCVVLKMVSFVGRFIFVFGLSTNGGFTVLPVSMFSVIWEAILQWGIKVTGYSSCSPSCAILHWKKGLVPLLCGTSLSQVNKPQ